MRNNHDLFLLYLKDVNSFDDEPKKRKVKLSKAELLLAITLAISAGVITLWAVIEEIITKLRL